MGLGLLEAAYMNLIIDFISCVKVKVVFLKSNIFL